MAEIPAYYQSEMAVALPGQVSDTSAYNIDGACVVDGDADILVGVAVQIASVDPLGHKLIRGMAAGKKPYGIAIRSHFQTDSSGANMVYKSGSGINIMTKGRVWMRSSDATLTAQPYGTPLMVDANGLANTATGEDVTNIATGWVYTGSVTTFKGIKLAEVQLLQV